jgi:septal ring factor EnvC (AmiA/AmiB activator)
MPNVKSYYTTLVAIGISIFLSLMSLVRAGDTKDIAENREAIARTNSHVESVEKRAIQTSQDVAILKEAVATFNKRLEKFEQNQDESTKVLYKIYNEVKK